MQLCSNHGLYSQDIVNRSMSRLYFYDVVLDHVEPRKELKLIYFSNWLQKSNYTRQNYYKKNIVDDLGRSVKNKIALLYINILILAK